MSWTWQLEDASGAPVDPASLGVATVTLQQDGERVYGPMGLAAT
jgi:hypothetical protein